MSGGKRVTLSMEERLKVLKELKTSSIPIVAEKFHVHPVTVRRIQKNQTNIEAFSGQTKHQRRRRRIKKPLYEELEEKLFAWYVQRRTVGDFMSDNILLEKAAELKEDIPASIHFKVSKSWLQNFKRRRNIRLVKAYKEDPVEDDHLPQLVTTVSEGEVSEEEVPNVLTRRVKKRRISRKRRKEEGGGGGGGGEAKNEEGEKQNDDDEEKAKDGEEEAKDDEKVVKDEEETKDHEEKTKDDEEKAKDGEEEAKDDEEEAKSEEKAAKNVGKVNDKEEEESNAITRSQKFKFAVECLKFHTMRAAQLTLEIERLLQN